MRKLVVMVRNPRARELIAPTLLVLVFGISLLLKPQGIDLFGYAYDLSQSTVRNGVGLALLALGAGLVLASAGVDLSMAGVLALCGVLCAWLAHVLAPYLLPWSLLPILAIAGAIIGALIGGANGMAISMLRTPPLIMTWAVGTVCMISAAILAEVLPRYRDGAKLPSDPSGIPTNPALVQLLRDPQFLWMLLLFLFVALPAVLGAFNLARRARAVGANRISASYSGIRVGSTLIATYACSGALAGIAGVWMSLLERKAGTVTWSGVELSAIAIAVLGGTSMSGGQFSVGPIVCAAFLWSLLLSVLQRPDILPGFLAGPLQARAAEASFAVLLIFLVFVLGRRLSGDAVAIVVDSRVGDKV